MKVQDKKAIEQYRVWLDNIRKGQDNFNDKSINDKIERIERAKKDVAFFVKTYLPHYADSESAWFHIRLAKRVKNKKKLRRLVRWGRGLAKSVWADVIIPLWLWINEEDIYLVLVGNSETKAVKLLSDIQAEFEANERLIHDFGSQKLAGSWEEGDFATRDNRFIGVALGMGQSPRGLRKRKRRPNLIVVDDIEDKFTSKNPKRQDEIVKWITNDLIPTMDGDTQRYLHPNNDPWVRSIQNILEKEHPNWELDEIKAYNEETYEPAWIEKYSSTYYKDWEEDIGPLSARAEFNHEKHIEGKIFTDELIQWGKPPHRDHFDIIIGFWDVAFSGKSDYNSVRVIGLHGRNFWHLKAFTKKCKMVDAIRFMYDYEEGLPTTVVVHWYVESQFWNDPLKDALKIVEEEYGRPLNIIISERPKMHKYDRIVSGLSPYYQNSRIYYSDKEIANNDMKVSINQLKGIEPGYNTKDDAPDAEEQGIHLLSEYVQKDAFKARTRTKKSLRHNSKNRY